jgi:hypothetical protein
VPDDPGDVDVRPPTADQIDQLRRCYEYYRDRVPEGVRVELYGNRVRLEPGAFGQRGAVIAALAEALRSDLPDDAAVVTGPAAGTLDRAREQLARILAIEVPAGFIRVTHQYVGLEDDGAIGHVHLTLRDRWPADSPC